MPATSPAQSPGTLLISVVLWSRRSADTEGIVLAVLSGSIASGLGYAAWYTALPRLGAIAAANAQLSVPVIAALAGVVLFGEPVTLRLSVSSVLVLGGTALAVRRRLTLKPRGLPASASGLAAASESRALLLPARHFGNRVPISRAYFSSSIRVSLMLCNSAAISRRGFIRSVAPAHLEGLGQIFIRADRGKVIGHEDLLGFCCAPAVTVLWVAQAGWVPGRLSPLSGVPAVDCSAREHPRQHLVVQDEPMVEGRRDMQAHNRQQRVSQERVDIACQKARL